MCGLFGAIKLKRNATISTRRIARLARNMDTRGGDSVGWIVDDGNGLGITTKHLGLAHDVAREIRNDARGAWCIIGHTRYATHGAASEMINNHPHEYLGENAWGAVTHNGVISNHEETAKENHCNLLGECDSEILARLMELDSHLPMKTRAIDAVDSCNESSKITAVFVESHLQNERSELVIIARGNSLYYSVHNGVLYYSSTLLNLVDAKQLPQNALLHVGIDKGMNIQLGAVSAIKQDNGAFGFGFNDWRTYRLLDKAEKQYNREYAPPAKAKKKTTSPWWKDNL